MEYIELDNGMCLKTRTIYSFSKGAAYLTGTLKGATKDMLIFEDVHQQHAYIATGAWFSPDSPLEIPEEHYPLLIIKKREISDIVGV